MKTALLLLLVATTPPVHGKKVPKKVPPQYSVARIVEHYTVHYEGHQSFECGMVEINGSHIRFLKGHPPIHPTFQEYEPEMGSRHAPWLTVFKIICRKSRGVLLP